MRKHTRQLKTLTYQNWTGVGQKYIFNVKNLSQNLTSDI